MRGTRRRERAPGLVPDLEPDPVSESDLLPAPDSCTTNHSGKRHAPMPRCRSCRPSGSGQPAPRISIRIVPDPSAEQLRGWHESAGMNLLFAADVIG